jgi:hypothetical protein
VVHSLLLLLLLLLLRKSSRMNARSLRVQQVMQVERRVWTHARPPGRPSHPGAISWAAAVLCCAVLWID